MLKREPPVWHWCKPKPCSTSSLCPRGTQIWSYVSRKWIRMLRIGINIHRETPTHALNLLVIVVAEAKLKQPVQWVIGEVDEGAAGCHHDSRVDPSFSKSCRKQLKNQPPQNSCNFWSLFKSSAAAVRLFCIDRPRADETKIQGSSLKAVCYYGVTTTPPPPLLLFPDIIGVCAPGFTWRWGVAWVGPRCFHPVCAIFRPRAVSGEKRPSVPRVLCPNMVACK